MPRFAAAVLAMISLSPSCATYADDAEPAAQTRVIQGSVVDDKGRPVTSGRIYFAIDGGNSLFLKEASAAIDATGHYRVELKRLSSGGHLLPANTVLFYLLFAPGYRAGNDRIPAGNGPDTINVQLTPEPWKTVRFRLVDQNKQPVKVASVGAGIRPIDFEETVELDESGVGQVIRPKDRIIRIVASSPNHATTTAILLPTEDEAAIFEVPMFNPIRGRVIDAQGHPVSGIRIGSRGSTDGHQLKIVSLVDVLAPATVDAQGRFDLRLTIWAMSQPGKVSAHWQSFCFADESMRQFAFLCIDPLHIEPEYDVVLKPVRPLRITLIHPLMTPSREFSTNWSIEPTSSPEGSTFHYGVMNGVVPPISISGEGHRLAAVWPEGRYRLTIQSFAMDRHVEIDRIKTEITVPPGERPFILPPLHLQPSYSSEYVNELGPEINASDLKTGQPLKLADFRGKVVVLTFWGSWFEPAVERMTQLMRLQESFKDEEVVFIALHDQSIQSREEFDRKLDRAKRIDWKGRDLPFTVALDRPDPTLPADASPNGRGVSIARYSIPALPVTLLIGRNGKIVGVLDRLEHEETNIRINNALSAGN